MSKDDEQEVTVAPESEIEASSVSEATDLTPAGSFVGSAALQTIASGLAISHEDIQEFLGIYKGRELAETNYRNAQAEKLQADAEKSRADAGLVEERTRELKINNDRQEIEVGGIRRYFWAVRPLGFIFILASVVMLSFSVWRFLVGANENVIYWPEIALSTVGIAFTIAPSAAIKFLPKAKG